MNILVFLFVKSNFFLSFQQPVNNADFIIPVEIDGTVHQVITVASLSNLSKHVHPVPRHLTGRCLVIL